MSYTKGPWTVENVEYGDEVSDDLCILEGAPNFYCVAHIEPRFDGVRLKEMEMSNADLIAAAPDLYEAGKAVLYHDERGQGIGYAEAMRALLAAVAKAEGRK